MSSYVRKFWFVLFCVCALSLSSCSILTDNEGTGDFKILSSTENRDIEPLLMEYAKANDFALSIEYAGTMDIIDTLNTESENYDAVWLSNSIWINMIDKSANIKDWKFTSINPIVFGISQKKLESLGLDIRDIYTSDIVDAVRNEELSFVMPSATQTNSGASAYIGFLTCLAGNPQVLTSEDLDDVKLQEDLADLLKGVNRSSGSEEYVKEIFLKGKYEALVDYESSIISLNQALIEEGKRPLTLVYPKDGVALSNSPFAYIDNGNEEMHTRFLDLQTYVLSEEFQKELTATGRRAGYGGLVPYGDAAVFNPAWGIDTTQYLTAIKYPSADVIKKAFTMYQEKLRKPSNIVFCIDYSGSMAGQGIQELTDAMEFIFDYETASAEMIQFSDKDVITIIPFSTYAMEPFGTNYGDTNEEILQKIILQEPDGYTNIYDACEKGLDELNNVDSSLYNSSIVVMTDGASNKGSFRELQKGYDKLDNQIPIFGITFGKASLEQLNEIAELSNGKVFNGKDDLIQAFRTVRGYN